MRFIVSSFGCSVDKMISWLLFTIVSLGVTGWGIELGTISGNWTDFNCSILLIDDESVIVGGFKRLIGFFDDD